MFPWRARVPKTLEVLYSQESLWILEALLNIIASVNGDARFNPPIKQINGITLGRGASTFAGRVTPFGTVVPGGYEGGSGSGSDMYSATAGSESGMNMPTTGGGAVVAEADPGTGRYVNEDYVAVEVSQLRTVLSSAQPSPADASLVVAKRVPVKLNLLMDQRKVIELLTACGNARLMVEVRQVRWLPNTGAAPAAISGTESGANGGGNMENSMRGSGYGSGAATATAAAGPIISQNDVPIEIAGIVYVFNKTDEKKLGLEQIDENFNLETTSPTAPEPTDATPNEPALPTAEPVANPVAAVTPPEAGATAVAPTASATPVAQPPGATPPPE